MWWVNPICTIMGANLAGFYRFGRSSGGHIAGFLPAVRGTPQVSHHWVVEFYLPACLRWVRRSPRGVKQVRECMTCFRFLGSIHCPAECVCIGREGSERSP